LDLKNSELIREIINTILSGHDTLAIMPTGGEINLLSIASSLIFWNYNSNITAYRLDEDQVDSLKANGIEACFINSSQTSAEQQVHIENLKNNKVKMVYVAPKACLI
jgi:ATP-dependent DNA helicase RecQ